MGKEPTHIPGGDERTRDQTAPEAAPGDAERPDAASDAASGVSRETYEEAVAEAVKDVHGSRISIRWGVLLLFRNGSAGTLRVSPDSPLPPAGEYGLTARTAEAVVPIVRQAHVEGCDTRRVSVSRHRKGAIGMDDREQGYYLAMQFSVVHGISNWTTEAGPFATADAAIDATVGERDYASDYQRCTLTRVDELGRSEVIPHPRLAYKRQHDDWQAWHERERKTVPTGRGTTVQGARMGRPR